MTVKFKNDGKTRTFDSTNQEQVEAVRAEFEAIIAKGGFAGAVYPGETDAVQVREFPENAIDIFMVGPTVGG